MRLGLICLSLTALVGWWTLSAATDDETKPLAANIGNKIANVRLNDLTGKRHTLYDFKNERAIVAVFLSFDCPVSNSYIPTLNKLAKTYRQKNVTFLGICPTPEKAGTIAQQTKGFAITFPLLHDPKLQAVQAFSARKVPEAFVLDGKFTLRYRGRIDDTYFARLKKKAVTTKHDLRAALDEVLANKSVRVAVTEPIGCPIVLEQPPVTSTTVTYYRDVLPILQRRCQTCHRSGEVGPFSLMTYKQAVTWGTDIKDYTQSRKMPPWQPTSGLSFKDERKLTTKEIATLAAWVDNGMPVGDVAHAPSPRKFTTGWQLGEPDLILEPKGDITVAPDGRDLFRCFVLPTNLKEDKFVTAYEVRPGNRAVVHHTVHFLDIYKRGRRLEERFQKRQKPGDRDYGPGYNFMMGPGFFPPSGDAGGWAPGISPHPIKDVGFYLPKGTDFVVQIHYHRNGRVEKDRTKIGLYFTKSKQSRALQNMVLPGRLLMIPAGDDSYRVKGDMWVAQDCTLYTVIPHMHLIGKSIKATMTPPGGKSITLIGIDDWDYNWQDIYHFQKPIRVKAGTRFHVDAVYNNSPSNPNYPFDRPRPVFVGEQTTNEMCFVFFGVTTDDGRPVGMRFWRNGPVIRRLGALPKTARR